MSIEVVRKGVDDVHLLPRQPSLRSYVRRLTAVIFSFLKYGFQPTDMTMGQTLASCRSSRLALLSSSPGTESGGYGAVWPGRPAMASAERAPLDELPFADVSAADEGVRDMLGVGRGVDVEGWTRAKP